MAPSSQALTSLQCGCLSGAMIGCAIFGLLLPEAGWPEVGWPEGRGAATVWEGSVGQE